MITPLDREIIRQLDHAIPTTFDELAQALGWVIRRQLRARLAVLVDTELVRVVMDPKNRAVFLLTAPVGELLTGPDPYTDVVGILTGPDPLTADERDDLTRRTFDPRGAK